MTSLAAPDGYLWCRGRSGALHFLRTAELIHESEARKVARAVGGRWASLLPGSDGWAEVVQRAAVPAGHVGVGVGAGRPPAPALRGGRPGAGASRWTGPSPSESHKVPVNAELRRAFVARVGSTPFLPMTSAAQMPRRHRRPAHGQPATSDASAAG
jgi:hypothetical protein